MTKSRATAPAGAATLDTQPRARRSEARVAAGPAGSPVERTAEPAASKPVDLETRMQTNDHQAIRLWLRLLSTANMITAELRTRLRTEFDSTMSRFDLMAQLERAPQGLSMSEASKRMMVTNAAITGLTDRLVDEGYIERLDDRADRRTFIIRLTPAGREHFLAMAARHEAWVIELTAGLEEEKKALLKELLGELKSALPRR